MALKITNEYESNSCTRVCETILHILNAYCNPRFGLYCKRKKHDDLLSDKTISFSDINVAKNAVADEFYFVLFLSEVSLQFPFAAFIFVLRLMNDAHVLPRRNYDRDSCSSHKLPGCRFQNRK